MDPITAFFVNLIIGVVLSVVGTLAQQAFAPKRQDTKTAPGFRGTSSFGGKVPQYFLIGTIADPGKVEYENEWGESGGAPNANAVDVKSYGDLPISGMTGLYINGVSTTVSGSGHVTQGYPVTGDKAGYFWIEFFDGTQTSASSYLTGKFGSDADRPWTSSMVGTGIPYITATFQMAEGIWSGEPNVVPQFQGIPLYDPRQDTTAGGSGSQRRADPSTWAFSDNPMVIILNIEMGIHYNPPGATTLGDHVWGGKKTAAQLPYAEWAAAMDACDEDVDLAGGGTEKRFRGGRRINMNERPADVIKEFLIGANARIFHGMDGTVYPLVGVPDTADGSFSDSDVLGTEPLGTIPFPNLDQIINGATATYREPQQAWEDKETEPYYRSDLETLDDDRRQIKGLNLETTFSGTQAQRILKACVEESRRFIKHVVALPAEFAAYRPLQALAWTSDRFGYDAKLFLITAKTVTPMGVVVFGLQEIDPTDHDWVAGTDEQAITFAPVVVNRPPPQEAQGFSVAQAIGKDNSGQNRYPTIDVFWSSASVAVDVAAVRITVALPESEGSSTPGDTVWEGTAPRPELGEARIPQGLLRNERYLVQIQYISISGRPTTESSWLPITTPNVGLSSGDFSPEINESRQYTAQVLNDLREELQSLGNTVGQLDQSTKDQLVVKYNRAIAAVVNEALVRADETGSLASSITAVIAQYDDISASGLFSMVAEAAPTGYEVKITLAARLEAGGTAYTSAISALVKSDGSTVVLLDADNVVFTGSAVSVDGTTMVLNFDTGAFSITVPD